MKILTKEEESEHYRETLKGGTLGGLVGLGFGFAGVALASQRYHFFRTLTLPLKAFLITSSGTFAGIIAADHWSRAYEFKRNPKAVEYAEMQKERREHDEMGKSFTERAMEFARAERYKIVGGSWILSMVGAFSLVNRNKFLTGAQKLVQARVYAQFLTLGVLVASAAFEISDSRKQQGRYETVKYVDPKDPEHKRIIEKQIEIGGGKGAGGEREDRSGRDLWKDMVDAEEDRISQREHDEAKAKKDHQAKHHKKNGNGGKAEKKDDNHKDEKKDDQKSEKKDDQKSEKKGDQKSEEEDEGKEDSEDDNKDDSKKGAKDKKKK